MPQTKTPTTNGLLEQALEFTINLAAHRNGNGAVFTVLGELLKAYKEGKAGQFAQHVQDWQARKNTAELALPAEVN